MKRKKSKEVDLEHKKTLFFEIGFIIALGLVLIAFEWTTRPESVKGFQQKSEENIVQEEVPVTRRQEKKEQPPPPPPSSTEQLNIVDDDVEIEDELRLEQTEADQDTRVQIDAFSEEDEEAEDEQQPFMVVEDPPQFQGGGVKTFHKYVQDHVEYPTVAAENGIEGTVYVQFVVDRDGGISNIKILRGVDPSLNNEAKRVIQNAPKWEPGEQRGKPVRVLLSLPIVFQLQ